MIATSEVLPFKYSSLIFRWKRSAVCLMVAFLFLASGRLYAQTADKPNVIIIMTDDQGYGDLACHGNPWIKTPNLDKLHSQSVRFTNFHSGTTCAPTRASLMTGKYNNKVGVWHTIIGREYLRPGEKTMADVFRAGGYKTGIFGKWHLGDNYPLRPQDRGFDEVLVHGGGGITQTPDYWNNDYFDDTYLHNGQPKTFLGYCTDVWLREATSFVQKNKETSFLCYISLNAPHGPFNVAPQYSNLYTDNPQIPNPAFYGMITNLDEQIGIFIENLKKMGVYQNTILLFMTDNGTAAGVKFDQAGMVTQGFNAGMRSVKGSQYEGGHRVPLFVHWPKMGWPARDLNGLAGVIDVLPTLMDLCKIGDGKDTFDGMSLASAIVNTHPIDTNRMLVVDTQRESQLILGKQYAVMQGPWRLVDGERLYNIESDPAQRQDLARQNPAKTRAMQSFYAAWWKDVSRYKGEFIRVVIGEQDQPTVCLTSHDFYVSEGAPAWNQSMVRNAQGDKGPWKIMVANAGRYRISLCRYPVESGLSLKDAALSQPLTPGAEPYPIGKKLEIQRAKIIIAGVNKEMKVAPNALSADFEVYLPSGETDLEALLIDHANNQYGAYYAYISKI